jgi:copper transport protein
MKEVRDEIRQRYYPITRPATRSAEGDWQIGDLSVPIGGHWNIRVDVLISDFDKIPLDGTIEIRP